MHAHDHPSLAAPRERGGDGFLERRDARAKLVAALALVLAAVLAPHGEWRRLELLVLPVVAFAALGKTAPERVLLRATVVLPFALLAAVFLPFSGGERVIWETTLGSLHARATAEGCERLLSVLARSSLSAVALASLALSTDLADLVRGLAGLGVPRVIVLTMSFTLRYLTLLREEGARLALAREMRTFGWRPALAMRAMGHSAGTLFVRTFERAERVHAAMAARGYEGKMPSLSSPRLGLADIALAGTAIALALATLLLPLSLT